MCPVRTGEGVTGLQGPQRKRGFPKQVPEKRHEVAEGAERILPLPSNSLILGALEREQALFATASLAGRAGFG